MGLRFVPFVSTCFTKRLGVSYQNLGFHYNQILNHWLEIDMATIKAFETTNTMPKHVFHDLDIYN
jgi:hypothetical protein